MVTKNQIFFSDHFFQVNEEWSNWWCATVPMAIGKPCISEFMIASNFPVMIKRSHFAEIREHITKTTNSATFSEAFSKICGYGDHGSNYSQFDLIVHFLWWFKREEYSWHLQHPILSNSPFYPNKPTRSNDTEVLNANVPWIRICKHMFGGPQKGYYQAEFEFLSDYFCFSNKWKAANCPQLKNDILDAAVANNLAVDLKIRTALWQERKFPVIDMEQYELEKPWVSDKVPDFKTYINKHLEDVERLSDYFPYKKS